MGEVYIVDEHFILRLLHLILLHGRPPHPMINLLHSVTFLLNTLPLTCSTSLLLWKCCLDYKECK